MGGSSSSVASKEGECRTEIKVTRFNYTWTIKNHRYCRKETGQYLESTPFETVDDGYSVWRLRVYPKGDKKENEGCVSLSLKLVSSKTAEVSTQFTLSLVDQNGRAANTVSLEHVFTGRSDECVGHPEIRDILQNNEVKISCELNIVDTETSVEECKSPALEIPPSRLSEDMEKLFENKEHCDFSVCCGGKAIQCHKAILAARSSVFLRKLQNYTPESKQDADAASDVDENAMEDLLRFLYTGKPPPKEKLTKELLIAAHTYDIQRLKLMCEEALSSALSIESAVELLILAENYRAEKLKDLALQFIVKNMKSVMGTIQWQEIDHEHHSLFVEVSRRFSSS